jgi:hypothetical protein
MPGSEEALDILQKATGVPLSWAGQTEKGKATFGNATVSRMPAWQVMQQLAATQVTDGKWEKTGDGYVLHGIPKDFGPRPDPEKVKADKKAFAEGVARKKQEYQEALAKNAKLHADYARLHPLGLDPKLRATFKVEKGATLPELMDLMRSATGLDFALSSSLAHHDPVLGFVDTPKAPAYWVMQVIAARGLDDGRWEKNDGGYRLEGVSHTPKPPSNLGWVWILVGGTLFFALAGGAFLTYRRRTNKLPVATDQKKST